MKAFYDIINSEKYAFLILFITYALFPTNNSSLDAYYYAASVKFSQHLFSPHHLLYNVFIGLVYKPIHILNIDVLAFSKFINTLFSTLTLYTLYKILLLLKYSKKETITYVYLVGFSFIFWRYGTENETYIIPVFFSLLSSYWLLKYFREENTLSVILSSFLV